MLEAPEEQEFNRPRELNSLTVIDQTDLLQTTNLNELLLPSRLVTVSTVYYSMPRARPIIAENRHAKSVDSQEEPYVRNLAIGPVWRKLDFGWLGAETGIGADIPLLLVIENREGQDLMVVPTPEERASLKQRMVEIGVGDLNISLFSQVPPDDSIRIYLVPKWNYFLRGIGADKVQVRCSLFPAKV